MTDEVVPLGGDRFEQRVPVDRRRMEAMITGKPDDNGEIYPPAEDFFEDLMSRTGALVSWPAQLKIGAKTRRDPFVKVQGTLDQVTKAADLIKRHLHAKKPRVTLKMEIHHSLHSNLIGKGGRGIQQIMKMTQCHIHFPDSNKYSENQVKSDQVSISGSPENVSEARKYLRDILPYAITFELPWLGAGHPTAAPTDVVSWQMTQVGLYQCTIRGTNEQELHFLHGLNAALQRFGLPLDYPVVVNLTVPAKSETARLLKSPEYRFTLRELSCEISAQPPVNDGFLVLSGPIGGVLAARKLIIGLSPAILSFDVVSDKDLSSWTADNNRGNVALVFKKKGPSQTTVTMKGNEASLSEMFEMRTNIFTRIALEHHIPAFDLRPSLSMETFDYNRSYDFSRDGPKSPDPEDSPLAASILNGVKEIDRNTGNWKRKNDREQMLLKAAQVVFDEVPSSNPRYPTDHWAGYGLSYSLPADLLKGLLSSPHEEPPGRMIEGRNARTPPRNNGLCSVREEDELSDFSDSLSSRSTRSRNICFEQPRRAAFSASTSIFDSSPMMSELSWDIRNFTDPAMVLTQLGCSEYLALMREQEIDMHAFLLLNEENLKDIGVSTIGARKKIHHAIRKLRDSARLHGYAI